MEPFSLFLLWLLFGCRSGGGAPALPLGLPGGEPGWPGSPISYAPPWPQAVPTGLPPFPGPGWEFDEPPPPAVQQRARQLVDPLWREGSGASRVEQTAGRWIAYQAQLVASGRKGVVAYRLKRAAAPLPQAVSHVLRRPARAAAPRAAAPVAYVPGAVHPGHATPLPPSSRAAPTVSPVSPVRLPTLVRGAGIKPKPPSPNVRVLQQRLGIKDDGQFGAGTEQAVRAFQRAHGLSVDGIVGDKTWTALFASTRA